MVTVLIFDNSKYELLFQKDFDREIEIRDIKKEILSFYEEKDCKFQLRKGDKELRDSTKLKELEENLLCFNFYSEVILDKTSKEKLKVIVNKNDIIFKDGRAYFKIENNFYKMVGNFFTKFGNALKKELVVKFSLILFLVFIDNIEVALLFLTLSALRVLGKRSFNITKRLEGVFKSFFKTVFLFFYTMFVISGDERIMTL